MDPNFNYSPITQEIGEAPYPMDPRQMYNPIWRAFVDPYLLENEFDSSDLLEDNLLDDGSYRQYGPYMSYGYPRPIRRRRRRHRRRRPYYYYPYYYPYYDYEDYDYYD